jgi:hypothetical protein
MNPYKKGQSIKCTACSMNPGCIKTRGKPGYNKDDCRLGRTIVKQAGGTELESQQYRIAVCRPTKTADAAYKTCTVCDAHQYTRANCNIGFPLTPSMKGNKAGRNTVCRPCPANKEGLKSSCDAKALRCPMKKQGFAPFPATSKCVGCTGVQKETWGNCCKGGRLGKQCMWKRQNSGCFKNGKHYLERTAKRGGFKGFKERGVPMAAQTGPNGFVRWCKAICETDSSCTAFEVDACLLKTKGACPVTDNTLCALTKETKVGGAKVGGKAGKVCFQNPKNYK